MLAVLGVVGFILALLVSVMLHEAGHFLTARRYGMKATQFFVGFGPTLWSFRRGETEYGVKAIPAGGFVKIVGMTELEEIAPEDEERAFYRHSPWQRTVVLAAGSTVHFLLTILLVFFGTLAVGVVDRDAPVVSTPVAQVPQSVEEGTPDVQAPAAAVLQRGDRILAIDGQAVTTWEEAVLQIRSSPGEELSLRIEREGREQVVAITPVEVTRPALEGSGSEQVGVIGVAQRVSTRHVGPLVAAEETVTTLGLIVTGTWETITERLDSVTKLYAPDRDPQGLVGVVGAGRISGEILGSPELTPSVRILSFILLIAGLNFFVGVFNLLPLLPLDGGHIAVVFFEQIRHRLRRLRGYVGEVQRVDFTKLLPLTYTVMLLFIGLSLFILGADIVNPVTLRE